MESQLIWNELYHKFCIELKKDFSDQNIPAWLSHFKPNATIKVYQYGKDATGKSGKGKNINVYTGSWVSSLIAFKIPAKLMAKSLFRRLRKQDYSRSDIHLLGIHSTENHVTAHIRFERFNTSGKKYHIAHGLYNLEKSDALWHITEMRVYDNEDDLKKNMIYSSLWHPQTD